MYGRTTLEGIKVRQKKKEKKKRKEKEEKNDSRRADAPLRLSLGGTLVPKGPVVPWTRPKDCRRFVQDAVRLKRENVPRRTDALLRYPWVTGKCLKVQFHPGFDPKMVAASSRFSPVRRERQKRGIELSFSITTRRSIFIRRQKRVAPVRSGSRREINNLDHIGSLQAKKLVTLVLDRERANKKTGSHWFLEGKRIGTLRCSIIKREQPRRMIRRPIFSFFLSLISLIADGPHHYHPACGHKGSSHLSPVHALRFFIAMQVQHSYNSSTNG